MIEKWKDIKGYEGLYQVSNLGNVKRLQHEDFRCRQGYRIMKERPLTPFLNHNGYLLVRLQKNNIPKTWRVHRLVALAFLENPFNYTDVNHKDEVKTNNSVDNLEWCTRKYNNNYGTKRERIRKAMIGNTNGRKSWYTKRSEVQE